MKHKVFISFKTENIEYKEYIQNDLDIEIIDKSLNEPIRSEDEDYIMRRIREDYLQDSTVTIALIGSHSAQNLHPYSENQTYIKRELQSSLYSGKGNSKNGILAVILPEMKDIVYPSPNKTTSIIDGTEVSIAKISTNTVISEISANYYLNSPLHNSSKDYWAENERYVVAVAWNDFIKSPNEYIETAFLKRSAPVAAYTKVRPD